MASKREKRKANKSRGSQAHKRYMGLLELSCNPVLPLSDRIEILRRLPPKYFIKAIDETLELKLLPKDSRKTLEYYRNEVWLNKISVKDAVDELETNRTDLGSGQERGENQNG